MLGRCAPRHNWRGYGLKAGNGPAASPALREQRLQEFAVDVGEAEVAALETKGELRVVHAEQVEHRRVDVVHVGAVGDGVETELVGFADNGAGFRAAAGEPHREGVDVMIATGGVAVFAHGSAAEFAAPDDERVFEETAGLEVFDEGGLALVDLAAARLKIVLQIFFRPPWLSQLVW
jgi:hypothetical protein